MTISTPSTLRSRPNPTAGFTLVEVLVALALSAIVMAGVLSTYITIVRSGYSLWDYTDMELESQRGLEIFARDARSASSITWNSPTTITLSVPTSGPDESHQYQFDPVLGTFTRRVLTTGAAPEILLSRIDSHSIGLRGFKLTTDPATKNPFSVDLTDLLQASIDTKQIQLCFKLSRIRPSLPQATSNVISARFVLRNKRVTT